MVCRVCAIHIRVAGGGAALGMLTLSDFIWFGCRRRPVALDAGEMTLGFEKPARVEGDTDRNIEAPRC